MLSFSQLPAVSTFKLNFEFAASTFTYILFSVLFSPTHLLLPSVFGPASILWDSGILRSDVRARASDFLSPGPGPALNFFNNLIK